MMKYTKQRSLKTGLPPGSLVHIGEKVSESTIIEVFEYNADEFKEYKFQEDEISEFELIPPMENGKVRWINVDGLQNVDNIELIGKTFNIHSLVMEDILNTTQRPKIENYNNYLFVVAKMLYFNNEELINEQFSIILGDGFLITFGEKKGDVFDLIRDRIRKGGRIRGLGADYLAYSLLDAIVDGYFYVIERLGDNIDIVEEELLSNPTTKNLFSIREMKRDLLYMHKSVLPLREVASSMERDDYPLILKSTQIYIRDVYDHTIQVIETTETYRELLSGLMDIYLSSVSNKMNEVMKVLTIISTIFIPLTFIVGVYGMNFKYMPELELKWGYGFVLIAMISIAIIMVLYFKRKKWL